MTDHSGEAGGSAGLELDVDGDGSPDVFVPGLLSSPQPTAFDREDTSSYLNLAEENLPPTSSPYSPMGRIEHQGYALRNVMSRPSWQRSVVKAGFWVFVGLIALLIVAGLVK